MALPIKHTPAISGKDSKRFNKIISKSESERITPSKRRKLKKLVQSVLKNSNLANPSLS
jgi:hypothetical protein